MHRATGPNRYTNMLLRVPQTVISTHSFIHSFAFIQGVPTIYGHTKRVSSSNENKEKCSYKRMAGYKRFLSLFEILHSTIYTLTMQYFTDNCHKVKLKVKVKFTLEQATMAQERE